ncbi:hypothetical protein GCM10023171_33590 [Microbacterium panaciterrae]|uniref:Uncharacterized protein n=1 Tax=Microbacterium panaciterrae TaxID=985759 RepID=A0ABP8PSW7_9MICO
MTGEQIADRGGGRGDARERYTAGIALEQLHVQRRPRGIPIAVVRVTAGQAGRAAGDDERPDRRAAGVEGHRQVRAVLGQRRHRVPRGHRAMPDQQGGRGRVVHDVDAGVVQGLLEPEHRPGADDRGGDQPDRMPCGVRDEQGVEQGAQPARGGQGRAESVREDLEAPLRHAAGELMQQPRQPGALDGQRQGCVEAELHGVRVAPQHGVRRIEVKRRGHATIMTAPASAAGARCGIGG